MAEKCRFKLYINARTSLRSGHVRNSINGSGSILPSSLAKFVRGKTFCQSGRARLPQKISLTRAFAKIFANFIFAQLSCCRGICRLVLLHTDFTTPPYLPSHQSLVKENGQ